MNAEKLQEFLNKLDELLAEYDVAMVADNLGEIYLDNKTRTLGYWGARVTASEFKSWL